MSNKTQLQTNNDALDRYISRVNAAKDIATNLPEAGGSEPVIEPLEITENGIYTAPDGVDGYSPVSVNVPIPDGYIVPSGRLEVTENGTHDVTAYAEVNVDVESSGGEEVFWGEVNTTTSNRPAVMYVRNMVYPHETERLTEYSQCSQMETFEAPYYTGIIPQYMFFNCAKLKSIKFPRVSAIANYFIRQQGVTSVIEEIQLGSIGYPFTKLANNWNYGNNHAGCTITFYVDATTIAEAQTAITNWTSYGGQNTSKCTLVFRNSTTGEVIME